MTSPIRISADGTHPDNPLDIAIVGGGVSGLFTGWRLITCPRGKSAKLDQMTSMHGGPLRVTLFEMSNYLGGRLLTLIPPGMPSHIAELGGMRFMSTQQLVTRLVKKHLKLEYEDALINSANIAYPRTWEAQNLHSPVPGGVAPEESLSDAIKAIIGQDPFKLTDEERLQIKQQGEWGGRALYDWGFLNLLNRVMSPHSYSLVAGPSGLAGLTGNWNAADAIFWFLARLNHEIKYLRPVKGMQEIPRRLAQLITDHGGTVVHNRELSGFTVDSFGTVKLTFKSSQSSYAGKRPIELPPVYARHLVLAMPRRALERIAEQRATDVLSEPEIRALICSVTPVPACHLICCYHEPWWERADKGGTGQRLVTGIPIRQALYLGTEGSVSEESTRKNSLILLTNDENTIKYWIGLLRQNGRSKDPYRGDSWDEYCASEMMVDEAHRLLRTIHRIDPDDPYPRMPYAAAMRDWSADPYGGQCNMWKIHEKSWQVSEHIIQPAMNKPVYICGEAYSPEQGWVEGALNRAEHLVRSVFGVPEL